MLASVWEVSVHTAYVEQRGCKPRFSSSGSQAHEYTRTTRGELWGVEASEQPANVEVAPRHLMKERTLSQNSRIIPLQGLQGKVTYTDQWGHQVKLDDLFVAGCDVRYIHIPGDVTITATSEQQLWNIHCVCNFGGQGEGWKESPSTRHK
uniref:U7 snRNA-associated Sm-like protein LSm10 n=1 Tax=Jaculus jaculus TaxID=51337 RepID=UPI001E1B17D0|nr:U7 snRNA-associated Sm-like protein LSm10 [Jaculus jaculus]